MVKMITACTRELHRLDTAVQDILGQLNIGSRLLKNSVGVISCAVDFVETGVLKALSEALPFDVVGTTTRGNAAGGQYGFDLLCLSVLTSDDISFSTVFSRPLSQDNIEAPVRDAFDRASVSGKPSFILAYPPLIRELGSKVIFDQINRCAEDVPVFGSLSCDNTTLFTDCKTIWNGQAVPDVMAMIFMYGDVRPLFFTASLPAKNLIKGSGLVTESESEIVKKVDNMSFSDFLKKTFLTGIDSIHLIPFMVKIENHAKPLVTTLYSITPEGYGVFGNDIPAGSDLTLGGSLDHGGIISTTEDALRELFGERHKISCAFMHPCVIRNIALGANVNDELERAVSIIGDRIPYQIFYSGGEICPVKSTEGSLKNYIHNYTFTICAFESGGVSRGENG
jgi:hypothetical protein